MHVSTFSLSNRRFIALLDKSASRYDKQWQAIINFTVSGQPGNQPCLWAWTFWGIAKALSNIITSNQLSSRLPSNTLEGLICTEATATPSDKYIQSNILSSCNFVKTIIKQNQTGSNVSVWRIDAKRSSDQHALSIGQNEWRHQRSIQALPWRCSVSQPASLAIRQLQSAGIQQEINVLEYEVSCGSLTHPQRGWRAESEPTFLALT